MLQVISFPITNPTEINAALKKYRVAKGAQILVSEGNICIPIEDGQPEPRELRINSLKELMYGVERERGVVEQSQKCVEAEMADLKDDINTAEAGMQRQKDAGYIKSAERKDLEAKLNFFQNKLNEKEAQHLMNRKEIARLNINISVYEQQIESLETSNEK